MNVKVQVRQRQPEVVEPSTASDALIERHGRAVDDDVVWAEPQARETHVVAHLQDERVRRGAIRARSEQKRKTLGPKLVVHLLARYRFEHRLDLALRHARV